ncbi:MAG: helix-turn-helix domain-containing protein [Bdellovibrionota bacterium]
MARTHYQAATDSLKLALKKEGITYKELARRLKLSESGMKKILSAKDGSFERIAEICGELGLSLGELLAGREEGMFELSYTSAQQEYLVRDLRALRLYWALVYERRSLAEAQKVAGLPRAEAFAVLRRLDQLELLALLPGDRVRVPPVRQIRWVGGGPLVDKLYREWSAAFLASVATPSSKPGQQFVTRYFRASQRTLDDLMAAVRDLETEFVRRAISEMRTDAPGLVHIRWMSAVDNRSYLDG